MNITDESTSVAAPTGSCRYTIRERLRAALGYGRMPEDSAAVIVDWLQGTFGPESVLDVGCGGGAFLRRFKSYGVQTTGLDACAVWPKGVDDFRSIDLNLCAWQEFPAADLTMCLEVAEHLEVSVANVLVSRLCESAPVVIFGGGIPGQGGWGHVNEQWASWWARLFEANRYAPHDDLRRHLWNRPSVAPWYAQDLLIYCSENTAAMHGFRRADPLDVVHPRSWERIGPMGIWQRIKRAVNTELTGPSAGPVQ